MQSVLERVEQACPGKGTLITQIWRLKQLEYTWLRTCMDAFVPFDVITRDSLAYALQAAGVEADAALLDGLAEAYLHLAPAPEAADALRALEGRPRAIFSNGSVGMLDALVRNSGLQSSLDHVISVDPARAYKPSAKAYALVEQNDRPSPRRGAVRLLQRLRRPPAPSGSASRSPGCAAAAVQDLHQPAPAPRRCSRPSASTPRCLVRSRTTPSTT